MGHSTARQSFNMMLITIFGAVALLLAAIGIYGLMAYSVEQRTHEMGIRMALGADRHAIRKLVAWQGMRLALVGVFVGVAAGFGLTRLIASLLFGSRRGTRWRSSLPPQCSSWWRWSRCGFRPRGLPGSTRFRPCARSRCASCRLTFPACVTTSLESPQAGRRLQPYSPRPFRADPTA